MEQLGIENAAIKWDPGQDQVVVNDKNLKIDHLTLKAGASYSDKTCIEKGVKTAFSLASIDDFICGFKKIQSKNMPQYDSDAVLYQHIKTGALLLNYKNNSEEKILSIGFKIPSNEKREVFEFLSNAVFAGSRN